MRSKATCDDAVVVDWGGFKSTVEDDKARQVVRGWQQIQSELAQCQTPKERMALYEKQLTDTRDALERISDLIRRKTSDNADSTVLQSIKSYLEFLKMLGTASRYLAMIENTKSEKKSKPQDFLRLYDSVIEVYRELLQLPGVEYDKNLVQAVEAKIEYYRAFRCHHMAAAYAALSRFGEAVALFERALQRIKDAKGKLSKLKGNSYMQEETVQALTNLATEVEQARIAAKAKRLASAAGIGDETDENAAREIDDRPLIDTLAEWRQWDVATALKEKRNIPVAEMPPPFILMPNKPLFFDLALNHIKMPDLEDRLVKCIEGSKTIPVSKKAAEAAKAKGAGEEQQQSGLSGMVKGWIWGKK
ncbi:hypothetical protein OESDEN_11768 [Oesophagostomum dentatum]|uniref:Uncharacterized protein n=1 Tax=Oesophagostomum dentatum TaxID=61180 RepID=A0A0B1STZ6_OESDE|nr:hypothetical protein OESDEN_11768 [Oesophagostomum dentatum]